MTNLIADFPSKWMVSQESPAERSVRFAETSTLTFIEPSTREELATMWYSNEEHHHQKRRFKLHVHTLSNKLLTTPISLINQEVIYACIGMKVSSFNFLLTPIFNNWDSSHPLVMRQALLSHNELKWKVYHRLRHVRTLLAAQARQRTLNIHDDEELSLLSQRRSKRLQFALSYWDILKW